MRGISKIVSGVLVGAMVLGGVSSASAYERYGDRYPRRHYVRHHGINPNALLLGAVGALAVGAIIAGQHRSAPAYYDGYDGGDYNGSGYDGQDYNGGYYARPAYRSDYQYRQPLFAPVPRQVYFAPQPHRYHYQPAFDVREGYDRGY